MVDVADRRTRRRRQSEDEILRLARAVLADEGADGLTLRGLATRLGMAPSGVHYYFASRDDLVAALVTRSFQEMADTVDDATRDSRAPSLERWAVGATAYAHWAVGQPELFELAHSRATARLKGAPGLLDAKDRVAQSLMAPLLQAVHDGQAHAPVAAASATPLVRDQLLAWSRAAGLGLREDVLLGALLTYVSLQGQVLLVLSRSLPRELLQDDALLQAHLQVLAAGWRVGANRD